MVKITLEVEGMACGMCESHVNEAVRKSFPVKKVTSSHTRRRTEVIAEAPIEEAALRAAVEATGYSVRSVRTEPYEKRGFSLFRK